MSTIADRLKNLYDSMVIANSVTNEFVEALPDCYDAVEAKGGTIPAEPTAANLPQAILDIPTSSGLSADGLTFSTDPVNALDLIGTNKILTIDDNLVTSIVRDNAFYKMPITSIRMRALTQIGNLSPSITYVFSQCRSLTYAKFDSLVSNYGVETFSVCVSLKELYLPSMVRTARRMIDNCNALEILSMPNMTEFVGTDYAFMQNCYNLIDIEIGAWSSNVLFLQTWNPTNALSTSSSSLVKQGESFTNNREKLLYNIREHIAAKLDSTASATITFHANVYNAIQADSATVAAFPSSWTIAST